jgi:hypothetical protein
VADIRRPILKLVPFSPDRVKGSVPDLKIVDNNPDAALTATAQAGQDLRVPGVYVLNMRGEPCWNQQKHF